MAAKLWSEHTPEELEEELAALARREDAALFLLTTPSGRPAGFAQCGLRRDYVEGSSSSPVGYLEGLYVEEDCRGRGYGRRLVERCEDWARRKGCTQFASDCQLGNDQSWDFHLAVGFSEANCLICFIKDL